MFRFKSIIVILVLVSCTPKQEECIDTEHEHHIEVVNKTDSILSYADQKIHKIKQHQVEQKVFVDSLEHTIELEQHMIDDINRELNRKINVEKDLELTRQELEKALSECKRKEKELEDQAEKFVTEIEYYFDREVRLITVYKHKVDSLKNIIKLLEEQPTPIDINTTTNKKKKRRRNQK